MPVAGDGQRPAARGARGSARTAGGEASPPLGEAPRSTPGTLRDAPRAPSLGCSVVPGARAGGGAAGPVSGPAAGTLAGAGAGAFRRGAAARSRARSRARPPARSPARPRRTARDLRGPRRLVLRLELHVALHQRGGGGRGVGRAEAGVLVQHHHHNLRILHRREGREPGVVALEVGDLRRLEPLAPSFTTWAVPVFPAMVSPWCAARRRSRTAGSRRRAAPSARSSRVDCWIGSRPLCSGANDCSTFPSASSTRSTTCGLQTVPVASAP